jgi:eukaryotic-like serine/threonine-protein kinase
MQLYYERPREVRREATPVSEVVEKSGIPNAIPQRKVIMNPSEPDLKAIFSEALEHPSGPERSAFLDRACRENPRLYLQVEALLTSHDTGGFLGSESESADLHVASLDVVSEHDAIITLPHARMDEGSGAMIGPYKLLQKIGEGGMGVVFLAEQEKPVRRKVALKIIKPDMDTRQFVSRFEAERQALAMMNHPNIARVLDAATSETGRPFFVMELVDGMSITEYCDRNSLTPVERLELFIPVCQAIQHAHQKGIIHRDIKPSNVLVTLHEGKPVPKVIDFGVAKAVDQRLTENSMITELGAVIGTLEYMSSEQAEKGELDIDTRSDIYSLGVMLYELLTGSTPLERAKLCTLAYSEVLRRIREEEPTKPSTRLSESNDALSLISARRKTEPARLTKLVRGDLDWIVMKSLEKDRRRRYETATSLVRDIQRYLDGDPVEACPPSATYKLKKIARKHRVALLTAGAFAILLMAATVVSVALAVSANRERVRAEEGEQLAIEAVKQFRDAVVETPQLRNNPSLTPLRNNLLKGPLSFFTRLRDRLQTNPRTTHDSLERFALASFDLGELTNEIGDKGNALRAYEEARAIRERLAKEYPSHTKCQGELARTHNHIAILQADLGRSAEALASYERGRAIREQVMRAEPSIKEHQNEVAASYCNIGNLQKETGRPAEAMLSYEKARAISERLVAEDPARALFRFDLAMTYNNIGSLLSQMGRLEETLASYKQAFALFEPLARDNPSNTDYQSRLALSHHNIGDLMREMGRWPEALASHEQARKIQEQLASENPSVIRFQSELAYSYLSIGFLKNVTGRPAETLSSYEQARAIQERLAQENPAVIRFQSDLALTLHNIATELNRIGRPTEALSSYEQARVLRERLAGENPTISLHQINLAATLNDLGVLQGGMTRWAEAMGSFEQARAIRERLAREQPESPDIASELGGTLSNMAWVALNNRQFEKAWDHSKRAIEWQRKALAANPNRPQSRLFLANHLKNLIQSAEGLGRADEAAKAQGELDELHNSDPRIVALDARLSDVLKGQSPRDAAERLQLASHANERSLHAASARLYAEALANDPKLADDRQAQHPYNAACAAALAGSGKCKDDPQPDDGTRAKLRRQAREWLQAELAAWASCHDSGATEMKAKIAPILEHWKADSDLAGIRDEKELAKLPAEERSALKPLWTDVDRLLSKATGNK